MAKAALFTCYPLAIHPYWIKIWDFTDFNLNLFCSREICFVFQTNMFEINRKSGPHYAANFVAGCLLPTFSHYPGAKWFQMQTVQLNIFLLHFFWISYEMFTLVCFWLLKPWRRLIVFGKISSNQISRGGATLLLFAPQTNPPVVSCIALHIALCPLALLFTLHCIALYCTLHCIAALHSIVLHCIALYSIVCCNALCTCFAVGPTFWADHCILCCILLQVQEQLYLYNVSTCLLL